MMKRPHTLYAKSGDVHIAYQITGAGPVDLVWVSGFVSHLDLGWDDPAIVHLRERLGFEDRGAHHLKGVPGEWRLFAVRP